MTAQTGNCSHAGGTLKVSGECSKSTSIEPLSIKVPGVPCPARIGARVAQGRGLCTPGVRDVSL